MRKDESRWYSPNRQADTFDDVDEASRHVLELFSLLIFHEPVSERTGAPRMKYNARRALVIYPQVKFKICEMLF